LDVPVCAIGRGYFLDDHCCPHRRSGGDCDKRDVVWSRRCRTPIGFRLLWFRFTRIGYLSTLTSNIGPAYWLPFVLHAVLIILAAIVALSADAPQSTRMVVTHEKRHVSVANECCQEVRQRDHRPNLCPASGNLLERDG